MSVPICYGSDYFSGDIPARAFFTIPPKITGVTSAYRQTPEITRAAATVLADIVRNNPAPAGAELLVFGNADLGSGLLSGGVINRLHWRKFIPKTYPINYYTTEGGTGSQWTITDLASYPRLHVSGVAVKPQFGDKSNGTAVPSEGILDKISSYISSTMLRQENFLKNTNMDAAGIISGLAVTTLNTLAFMPGLISTILSSFLDGLGASNDQDNLKLTPSNIRYIYCPTLDTGTAKLPVNKDFSTSNTPVEQDKNALKRILDFLFEFLQYVTGSTPPSALARKIDFLKMLSELLGSVGNLFGIIPDSFIFTTDWDTTSDVAINEAIDHLEPFIKSLIILIDSIARSEALETNALYCDNEGIACILRNLQLSGGGSSGWTEEMINKVFVSPDVDEPYFKFSGGAIQAPWDMPE